MLTLGHNHDAPPHSHGALTGTRELSYPRRGKPSVTARLSQNEMHSLQFPGKKHISPLDPVLPNRHERPSFLGPSPLPTEASCPASSPPGSVGHAVLRKPHPGAGPLYRPRVPRRTRLATRLGGGKSSRKCGWRELMPSASADRQRGRPPSPFPALCLRSIFGISCRKPGVATQGFLREHTSVSHS